MQKTRISLFPLELLLLPGETRVLHIFEDRYRQLIADCESVHSDFGIPYTVGGTVTGFGSVVELVKILRRYPNGSCDIAVKAKSMFKVARFFLHHSNKPYPGGTVEAVDLGTWDPVSASLAVDTARYLASLNKTAPRELISMRCNAMDVARLLEVADTDRLALLKVTVHAQRERLLRENLAFLSLLQNQINSIQGEVFLN